MGDAPSQAERAELAAALRTYVEYQRELGVLGFPRAARPAPPPPAPAAPAVDRERPTAVPAPTRDLFTPPGLGATRTLEELRAHIGDCQRCKLAPHRTHLVFGVGNPRARLVFVGEAPGRDEDLRGSTATTSTSRTSSSAGRRRTATPSPTRSRAASPSSSASSS